MPECYLLAVSVGSALDENTNNWTLFSLAEQIELPHTAPSPASAKVAVPLEVHFYVQFDPSEVGQDLLFRLVQVCGAQESHSQGFRIKTNKGRHRTRIRGLPLFFEGDIRLCAEWRFDENASWQRFQAFWPLTVARGASATTAMASNEG
jgi:hypothetical protein